MPAPWSPTSPPLLNDEEGRLCFEGLTAARRVVPLGPFSPLFENEEVRRLSAPRAVQQGLGRVVQEGETWFLEQFSFTRVNGSATPRRVALSDGDVVDASSPRGPWQAWLVRFAGAPRGSSGLGPLWQPFRVGAFTLEPAGPGRWRGVLRAGTFAPRLDSLEWLRRILMSDFAAQLASLELHVAATVLTDWASLLTNHHELAQSAPFEVTLRAPRGAANALVPVGCSTASKEDDPITSAYGTGTRWINRSPAWFLNGAPDALMGWTTLCPGDRVERRGVHPVQGDFCELRDERGARGAAGAVTPWVLIPTQGKHLPLSRGTDGWSLSLDDAHLEFSAQADGLALVQADLSLTPVPWFTAVRLRGVGCVFLPGPSPFLAGEHPFPSQAALAVEDVRRFGETLSERGDVAAEGLLAIAAGAPTAARWLARLLTPFGQVSVLHGACSHDDGEHCCGFFTVLRVAPWMDFDRDLPVLLAHPLMVRLQRLELFPRPNLLRPSDLVALRKQALRLRPELEIVLPVRRLR